MNERSAHHWRTAHRRHHHHRTPHRPAPPVEIVFHNIGARLIIRHAALDRKRAWLLNPRRTPSSFHLKGGVDADLPATARDHRSGRATPIADWMRRTPGAAGCQR
jgi:hypothetical protein